MWLAWEGGVFCDELEEPFGPGIRKNSVKERPKEGKKITIHIYFAEVAAQGFGARTRK